MIVMFQTYCDELKAQGDANPCTLLPQMVTNNLRYYDTLLLSGRPLFTVEALLSPPEIILHPHASELFKLMTQAMLEVVEGYVMVVVQTPPASQGPLCIPIHVGKWCSFVAMGT